ncbi:MAG: DUF4159 domain-containing protein [Candidatus Latescibacteria bacterium]|nr:DUF4159 domain-containing protein [Candidatus Latescibacterota bacterium]
MRRHRTAYICLLASLLLHLTALYLGDHLWRDELDAEAFRVRLARIPPQFKPPRPIPLPPLDIEALKVEMEYLRTDQPAVSVRDPNLESEATPPEIESPTAPLALGEMAVGAKEDAPILEREKMISPSSLGLADSMGVAAMDLLRIEDMARANKDHAAIIPSRATRRDLSGYVNFTQLRVYGASSGRGTLDALSRYLRDHTHLLARVRDKTYEYFLSEQLLKDPIHFLFEDSLSAYDPNILTKFSAEEKALLGRYLREGGFLFIEGTSRRTNHYLREMKDQLREILGPGARLAPIPTSHPIYHSFYEFGGGFPGEDKSRLEDAGDNPSWYYPVNNRYEVLALQEEQEATLFGASTLNTALPPPEGLWGVELDGELVAVISDLWLGNYWQASFNTEDEETPPATYALMAGTNILVYALTRKSGITPQLPPPAWMPGQRPVAMVQEAPLAIATAAADELLFDDLDAWLALVLAPIGNEITEDIAVRLDGRYSLELLKRGYQGLLFHNLSAGAHWVELSYGGQTQQEVTTLTFALNRFAFVVRLRVQEQEERADWQRWSAAFADLEVEEIYLAADREWLEGGP